MLALILMSDQRDTETETTDHLKKVALPPLLDFYWHDLKAFEEAINKTNIICLLVPSFKYLRDHFCNPIVMITSINVRFPPVPNLHVMDGFGRLLR